MILYFSIMGNYLFLILFLGLNGLVLLLSYVFKLLKCLLGVVQFFDLLLVFVFFFKGSLVSYCNLYGFLYVCIRIWL
ncbi:hypothetical protein Hanom_Chr09g00773681 [Helianthus anomalus]